MRVTGVGTGGGAASWQSAAGSFEAVQGATSTTINAGDRFYFLSRESSGSGQIAHLFDTENALAAGLLTEIRNNGTPVFGIDFGGRVAMAGANGDTRILEFGDEADANLANPGAPKLTFAYSTTAGNCWARLQPHNNDAALTPCVHLRYGAGVGVFNSDGSAAVDFFVVATGKVSFDGTAGSTTSAVGDSYIVKSAASGGNLSVFYDAAEKIRYDGTDWRVLASGKWGLYTAIGDAEPTAELISGGLALGAGGASAVDSGVERDAAGVVKITNGAGANTGLIKRIATPVTALADGANIASDWSLANNGRVTLGGNRQLSNPSNAVDGQVYTYEIIQDGTGNRGLTFDTKFKFGTDIASYTPSTAAGAADYITCKYNSSDDEFRVVAIVRGY